LDRGLRFDIHPCEKSDGGSCFVSPFEKGDRGGFVEIAKEW
jgi:hypothetical protein